ncbi:MAG: hypothetical protein NDJ19_00615 [Ramlibacter sp.]|nr:hypothetical protein [Ramlibacter sp.]
MAEKVGRGPCPHCGEPVTFKRTTGGKLSFSCDADDCDSSGYAEPDSGQYRRWMASVRKPAAAAPPAPTEAPKPAGKPGFSLGAV